MSKDYLIKIEDIYAVTDGGLDIILALYPQAQDVLYKHAKMFKTHEEDTASTSLFKKTDPSIPGGYLWFVTNFAKSQKGLSPLDCYMDVHGVDFATAIQQLAVQYNVKGADPAKLPRAKYSKRPATNNEEEGVNTYKIKETFSDFEIRTLIPKNVLAELKYYSRDENAKKAAHESIVRKFKTYNFYALESYTLVINREVMTFESTDNYPIFAFIENDGAEVDFVKVYQPLAPEKKYRFRYLSSKRPKHFLHGYAQAKAEFEKRKEDALADIPDYEDLDDDAKKAARKDAEVRKLSEIIIMSGGSDALTAALLDYWVVWPNSESAEIEPWQIAEMRKWAEKTYQLYDLDPTGRDQAHENCLKYLDLHDIELPAVLLTYKDRRQNPCKDLRDYFNYYTPYNFKDLIRVALPYRFWDRVPKYIGKGADRIQVGTQYVFNNVHAYNFLAKCGYFRMKFDDTKVGYRFVQRTGNIVDSIEPNEVKNYIHKFLADRFMDIDLRNAMFRTTHLSENSLSNLPIIDIKFIDSGKDFQYIFFRNSSLLVTADGIREFKPGGVESNVWRADVLDYHFRKLDPSFTIFFDQEHNHYDIEIHHLNCLFFRYLIQTSRIYWSDELIDRIKDLKPEEREQYRKDNQFNINGPLLTAEERLEQRQHLINKLFAIGYLMHRHKNPVRTWCVFAMDNHISEDGKSYGGSGKSIIFNEAVPAMLPQYFYIGGRNRKVTEKEFLYDGLTEHHRYIVIDDAHEYFDFETLFDSITGDLMVNPKHGKQYKIEFKKLGKYGITSNYTLRNISSSTERRVLYTVNSDYYHTAGDNSPYDFTCTPDIDLGKQLFTEFDNTEWNVFHNTMLSALQFYLSVPSGVKLNPPMSNVTKRNLMAEMTPDFLEWATEFFYEEGDNVDRYIIREVAFETFDRRYKKGWKTQKFTTALRAFCRFKGFIYNPNDLINSKSGTPRIMHKVAEVKFNARDGRWESTGRKVPKDMIYIQTNINKEYNTVILSPADNIDLPVPKPGTEAPDWTM